VKVLVTGGTSLLGRGVAEWLRDRGDEVTVFQRHASGLDLPERLGDVGDRAAVAAAVDGSDTVVHLAARVGVTGRWSAFESTNIDGTRNLIEESLEAGVGRFVFVSSPSVAHAGSSLVGAGPGRAAPGATRGHYATSKAAAELIALGAATGGFAVTAIRPHLVWGPGDTQLVGRIVDRARQGRLAIVGTGAALIDTTYIDNAVAAIAAAVDRAPLLSGRALVVSNGQPRPVRELLSRIVAAAGLPSPRFRVPAPAAKAGGRVAEEVWDRRGFEADPPMTSFLAQQLATAHWFDQRETRRALDWTPAVTLEEGFTRLAAWFAA
jgi:nucleoside-diphosphate-sugar epimerase